MIITSYGKTHQLWSRTDNSEYKAVVRLKTGEYTHRASALDALRVDDMN